MGGTQLICPHCKSTLTFGTEIASGTPLTCLICMREFAATNPVKLAMKEEKPTESTRPLVPKTVEEEAAPVASPAPPTRGTPASGGAAGVSIVIVLFILFSIGVTYGIWRVTQGSSTGDSQVFADGTQSSNGSTEKKNDVKPVENGKPKSGEPERKIGPKGVGGDSPKYTKPKLTEQEEEDIRKKLEDELTQSLKRSKSTSNQGTEPKFDPITTVTQAARQIPGVDQKKIDAAIERGIGYLKKTQLAKGGWHENDEGPSHAIGYAAFAGLTLVECGVPASDAAVQRAAAYVRSKIAFSDQTYDLSVAILFLDRLGDPRDRGRIQGMAMRLMAGQKNQGGWSYGNPMLDIKEMFQLYYYLESHRPAHQPRKELAQAAKAGANLSDPFDLLGDFIAKNVPAKGIKPVHPQNLVPQLQQLLVVTQMPSKTAGGGIDSLTGVGVDNSNTQLAVLALWAARRHGVPTERSLWLAHQYFSADQNSDGGWGYTPGKESSDTMTCAGLLGLALGHGVTPAAGPALKNPAIQKSLFSVARVIGQPTNDIAGQLPKVNLYLLWSIERVALVYDQNTIGGKDWYGWGAQILVYNQAVDGSWKFDNYSTVAETCFALLFLRRSNLVADLTTTLRLNTGIRNPN